jgi:hypothetical protein
MLYTVFFILFLEIDLYAFFVSQSYNYMEAIAPYTAPIESLSFIGKKVAAAAVIMHIYSVVSHRYRHTAHMCVIQSSHGLRAATAKINDCCIVYLVCFLSLIVHCDVYTLYFQS